jgi:hypothetical protein
LSISGGVFSIDGKRSVEDRVTKDLTDVMEPPKKKVCFDFDEISSGYH